jgi:hypothetical protein
MRLGLVLLSLSGALGVEFTGRIVNDRIIEKRNIEARTIETGVIEMASDKVANGLYARHLWVHDVPPRPLGECWWTWEGVQQWVTDKKRNLEFAIRKFVADDFIANKLKWIPSEFMPKIHAYLESQIMTVLSIYCEQKARDPKDGSVKSQLLQFILEQVK